MLPSPHPNQAFFEVSALQGGFFSSPLNLIVQDAKDGEVYSAPCLSFLLRYSETKVLTLFDLGVRKDFRSVWSESILKQLGITPTSGPEDGTVRVPKDVLDSLKEGGLKAQDIDTVILSHLHIDHTGDPSLFPTSKFILGGRGKRILSGEGAPVFFTPTDWTVPANLTTWLVPDWQPIGPFERGHDLFRDGSLFIIDAQGHVDGHINVLARTSADGSWIYFSGDSAHHWDIINGTKQIAYSHIGGIVKCMHADKEKSEDHIRRIRELDKEPRVRVVLAHDLPFYNKYKDIAFFPGKVPVL